MRRENNGICSATAPRCVEVLHINVLICEFHCEHPEDIMHFLEWYIFNFIIGEMYWECPVLH